MALEEMLLNYGILGIWTITLLIERRRMSEERQRYEEKLSAIIESNTAALTKAADAMNTCPLKKSN